MPLREQNIQVGAGQIGQPPAPVGQQFQIDIRAESRLNNIEDFEAVVVDSTDGNLIQLKDVGRVELGAENYGSFLRFRGKEAVGLGIFQIPGSNALDVARGVKETMATLSKKLSTGDDL